MDLEDLLGAVSRNTGVIDRDAALRVVTVTLSALTAELPTMDRDALAQEVPLELVDATVPMRSHGRFFRRVARKEGVDQGVAVEHAEGALRALAPRLGRELALRMKKHLPEEIAIHLEERATTPNVREPRPRPGETTLASGRVGSEQPVSEAKPERAHAHSVARSDDPHGETKLSSARGLTQERLDDSLATGAPKTPRRSLASG